LEEFYEKNVIVYFHAPVILMYEIYWALVFSWCNKCDRLTSEKKDLNMRASLRIKFYGWAKKVLYNSRSPSALYDSVKLSLFFGFVFKRLTISLIFSSKYAHNVCRILVIAL
jgi:hypothetical protein